MKRRFLNKLLFAALFALAIVCAINVKADATGYTYDHKNKVIYSTEGFTVNQTPYIYDTLGIKVNSFTEANPTDLFVYSAEDMGASDKAIDDTIVYLLDSGGATKDAKLYVFDSNLKLHREVYALRYNPNTILANLNAIKSAKGLVVNSHANPTTYTVTFIDPLAEGEDNVMGTSVAVVDKAAPSIIPVKHEGYYFTGWDGDFSAVTADMSVKAKYASIEEAQKEIDEQNQKLDEEGSDEKRLPDFKTVTVKYVDGVTKKTIGEYLIKSGDVAILPEAEIKEGYELEGWNYDGKALTSNTIITSQYKKIHTVTFVDSKNNDAVIDVQKIVDGNPADSPYVPYYEGFYLVGWDTEFDEVTSDLTVKTVYRTIEELHQEALDRNVAVLEANAPLVGSNSDANTAYKQYLDAKILELEGIIQTLTETQVEEENKEEIEANNTKLEAYNKLVEDFTKLLENYNKAMEDYDLALVAYNGTTENFEEVINNYNAAVVAANALITKINSAINKENGNIEVAEDKLATLKSIGKLEAEFVCVTVTFIDYDENLQEVVKKAYVLKGDDADAPKPANNNTVYNFNGWDNDGKAVVADITITSSYSKKTNGIELNDLYTQTEMYLYMAGANSVYRGVAKNISPYTDYLYICDTSNNQILVIDAKSYQETEEGKGTYELVQVITSPVSEIGSATFSPLKVVNDAAGRVYTICEGIEDGILEFSKTGSFDRYVGTNYVTLSAWEIFTRNFATEAQLDQFTTYQNTTFTSMVYKNNMIYTTSYSIKNKNGSINDNIMIKKINPSGKDVLRRNGYNKPKGDITYVQYNDDQGAIGTSQFVGITVNDYGVYTVVDNNRGRLFTYDNEGNLLYISGGSGNQLDKINIPIAVQYLGENLLVLDSKRRAIIFYEPTDIAKVINKAIECEYNGQSEEAYEYWEEVIQLNANYEHAYVGIGKHYMEATEIEDNYRLAMENFELGANPIYYSKAYKQYRDAKIKAWFPWVAGGLIIVIVGGVVYKKVRRKKLGIKEEEMTGMGDE